MLFLNILASERFLPFNNSKNSFKEGRVKTTGMFSFAFCSGS